MLNGIVLAGVILLAVLAVALAHVRSLVTSRAALVLLALIVALDLGSAFEGAVYGDAQAAPNAYIGVDWAGNPGDSVVRDLLVAQSTAAPARARFLPIGTASVWANGSLVWGFDNASGYVGLCPKIYCDLLQAANSDPGSQFIDLLNIR